MSRAADAAASPAPARHRDLWIARALTLGPVLLAFPVATAAVFGFGAERDRTAEVLAVGLSGSR